MKGMVFMKGKSEKEINDILSKAVEKDMPDVWDKIKNNTKSRFNDIECKTPKPIKSRQTFPTKRISSFAAAFVIIIAGIYLSLHYGSGILNMLNKKSNMSLDPRFYIVEINNTLYYQNFTDGCKLYSMDLNGDNKKKLCDDYVVKLKTDGERIYYENLNNLKNYSIKLDGLDRKELANFSGHMLDIFNDWIYFLGTGKDNYTGIYSIKKDGTGLKKLSNINAHTLQVYGNMIYFSEISDNGALYKMNLDGTNIEKISNESADNFKVSNNFVFFQRFDDKHIPYLYRLSMDRQEIQKILDYQLTTGAFDISGNNIFFISSENSCPSLYKMDINGNNIKKIAANFDATTIKVLGDWIYCYQPWGVLYKVDIDGKTKVEILSKIK